ncbi:MAG TPA: NifB/NifX family molybdenum-iron cluster-binding protein [Syntrophorhabdaceae bacterium]|nr:NifB/NifX family molybdenum-iron cluster-binding protein [Syntrophorhabdaceae bacterium]
MRVCFAIQEDKGMESQVYNHFGSAPAFVIVDTELNKTFSIKNRDLNHIHGACSPLSAIGGNNVDAVVVGGIGAGAIRGLNAAGIKVYKSLKETVKENLDLLTKNRLPELNMSHACKGHEGACGH